MENLNDLLKRADDNTDVDKEQEIIEGKKREEGKALGRKEKNASGKNKHVEETEVFPDPPNPFGRKPRVSRTLPQRERAKSVADPCVMVTRVQDERPRSKDLVIDLVKSARRDSISTSQDEEEQTKRKRREIYPSDAPESSEEDIVRREGNESRKKKYKESRSPRKRYLSRQEDILRKLKKEIAALDAYAQQRNTKVEIKEISKQLCMLIADLNLEDLDNINVQSQKEEKQVKEIGTQTVDPRVVTEIDEIVSLEHMREMVDRKWDKEVYTNTEVVEGNPINTKDSMVKVLFVEPEDSRMERGIRKLYIDRYPELVQASGEFEIIEQISRRKAEIGGTLASRKIIKININNYEDHLWEQIGRLKEEVKEDEGLAIHPLEHVPLEVFRKMMECRFHATNTRVYIFIKKGEGKDRQAAKQGKEPKTFAITLEEQGRSYKDILTKIKPIIKNSDAYTSIKGVRSTKDGKLLLTLDRNEQAVKNIREELDKHTRGLKITNLGESRRWKTMHIRGMDMCTIGSEVLGAIENEVGQVEQDKIRIGEIRPNRNDTTAVTVSMEKELADKVLQKGLLRIGLSACSVKERIPIQRCFRCWEYGHQGRECKGPDRTLLCLRCGQTGHHKTACEEEEACPLCETVGHSAGTFKCQVFKGALSRVKRNTSRDPNVL